MTQICPNCKESQYVPTGQRIVLKDVLNQWERETTARFSAETRAIYESIGTSDFYKCNACHFGAFIPAAAGTSGFYNDITVDSDYYVDEKWEFKKTYGLMNKYSVSSLLDFGCGGGAFLKKAVQKFPSCKLDGYDQNPQAVDGFKNTPIGFVNDLKAHDGKQYDMITAFQILEHLNDPFAALKDLKGKLKNNGIIIISVPNSEGPIRHFPDALTEIPPHHVNRFNRPSLKVYLENEGFKIEEFALEPLARILWPFYIPVMVRESLPPFLKKLYVRAYGYTLLSRFAKLLEKTGLKSLPIAGHSIYVVARKCAG